MNHEPALNEITLAQECLRHLGEDKSVLHRAAHVLQIVAHSSVGLGEVLQDYAHQAWGQLHDVIRAARNAASGQHTGEDIDILQNTHMAMKSVKTVLEMTPAAMLRNKADSIGDKEKLSRSQISEVTFAFMHSPDVERLLASEDSGRMLVGLLNQNESPLVSPEHANIFLAPTARH